MYAVIVTGGKQYRVSQGDVIKVPLLASTEEGQKISLDQVLMVGEGESTTIGTPTLSGAKVEGEIVAHDRTRKMIVFKKRRRKHSRRKNTHRQDFTVLRITAIKA